MHCSGVPSNVVADDATTTAQALQPVQLLSLPMQQPFLQQQHQQQQLLPMLQQLQQQQQHIQQQQQQHQQLLAQPQLQAPTYTLMAGSHAPFLLHALPADSFGLHDPHTFTVTDRQVRPVCCGARPVPVLRAAWPQPQPR